MNPKLNKVIAEIEKLKQKLANYQTRLRDLERQKTELENADIVALVRGVDVPPDELLAFIKAFRDKPSAIASTADGIHEQGSSQTNKEDTEIEIE